MHERFKKGRVKGPGPVREGGMLGTTISKCQFTPNAVLVVLICVCHHKVLFDCCTLTTFYHNFD
jgi:hypothetical protein